jgi:hypothetical protein
MTQRDPTIAAKVHKPDPDTLVVESGGQIIVMPGAKIGPNGSTVALPIAGAGQANVVQTQTALTDNTGGTVSTTLAAITAGASYAQADMVAAKNAIASLKAELTLARADVAALIVQNTALQAALVAAGIIKGSA